MGLLDWLSGKKKPMENLVPAPTFTIRVERGWIEPVYETFTGEVAGEPVKAEVPSEEKERCEHLMRKSNRSNDENQYLNDSYWVNVYYKGERHGYKGIGDLWTYSARSLPELPLLHGWIYSILGTRKAEIAGEIETLKTWEESGNICTLGEHSSVKIKLSFKPKGFILSFLIEDALRWSDKASYNTRTGEANFPFYYTNAQGKIIEWAKAVFEEKRVRPKGTS